MTPVPDKLLIKMSGITFIHYINQKHGYYLFIDAIDHHVTRIGKNPYRPFRRTNFPTESSRRSNFHISLKYYREFGEWI